MPLTLVHALSGTWTPTLTNGANVAASQAFAGRWLRVEFVVHFSVRVQIDPTAATTATELGISLPIPSAFSSGLQLAGVGIEEGAGALGVGQIIADATNDRASFNCWPTVDTARNWRLIGTYDIVV